MQANEKWLVLPGLVSAFILNDLLKKESFCGADQDIVKGNGITVKLEEETMMHVKINGGARCLSKELNSGNMVEEEGGHCGGCGGCGGCGSGSGCGGGGGRCGNMMTNENVTTGGGSCTGGSTGCGGCGGGCGNMMTNENVPSLVAEAPIDAVAA